MKAQGFDRTKLVYHSKLQPYLSIWGIFWVSIFILVNGIAVFWDFNASDFLTSCMSFLFSPLFSLSITHDDISLQSDINIPLFFLLYIVWKVLKRTKVWKPMEMDFVTGIPTIEETEHPVEPPKNFADKVFQFIF